MEYTGYIGINSAWHSLWPSCNILKRGKAIEANDIFPVHTNRMTFVVLNDRYQNHVKKKREEKKNERMKENSLSCVSRKF